LLITCWDLQPYERRKEFIMKNLRPASFLAAIVAATCLGTSVAQEVEGKAKLGNSEGKVQIQVQEPVDPDRDATRQNLDSERLNSRLQSTTAEHRSDVTRIHRASKIIGMGVKNQHGENLGEVKDLVLDLQTGRISYAVLGTGGFLGLREKYIAVPCEALMSGHDDNGLVMNVDKSAIEQAPSFAKNNWPDPSGVAWGAAFRDLRKDGTSPDTELRLNQEDRPFLQNRNEARLERRDQSERYDRTGRNGRVMRGRIVAVNSETRTITIEGDSGPLTFTVAERPTLTLKENRNPTLSDFKVGYPVTIGYHDEGDSHVAHSIIRSDAPEVK
jgi:sporulation protein YlmC with PRC-barrel domain